MSDAITRHPLAWPAGRPRTPAHRRDRPKFTAGSFAGVRDGLLAELRRLGARGVVLSTNVELRRDGLPYADRRNPEDPGVAVYFSRKGRDLALCCDRWTKVEDNMRAIADAVEAIRLIERRGTGEMVDAAFSGFAALPPAGGLAHPAGPENWWDVLGVFASTPTDEVVDKYRSLAKHFHPDRNPGDAAAEARFKAVGAAFEAFKRGRGL
jgi:hypothetical protein